MSRNQYLFKIVMHIKDLPYFLIYIMENTGDEKMTFNFFDSIFYKYMIYFFAGVEIVALFVYRFIAYLFTLFRIPIFMISIPLIFQKRLFYSADFLLQIFVVFDNLIQRTWYKPINTSCCIVRISSVSHK